MSLDKGLTGCNTAGIAEPFGEMNLQDINVFAAGFLTGELTVDLDGIINLDLQGINQFISEFLASNL